LGAPGKAIKAWMDEMERAKLLAKKKLYFYGDPCRMDMKRLGEEFNQCRDLGFAQDSMRRGLSYLVVDFS